MTVTVTMELAVREDLRAGWAELAAVWPVRVSRWWEEWALGWGQRRVEIVRVGRRGGKSTMLARIAVIEAVFGEHAVPPGDCGVVAVVSCDRRSRVFPPLDRVPGGGVGRGHA